MERNGLWRVLAPLAAASLLFLSPCLGRPESVSYQIKQAAGVRLHLVTVNLNDPQVRVSAVLAWDHVARSESFRSMLRRVHPTAAITGTFFSLRSLLPTGDMVINGKLVHQGEIGTAVCFTADNQVFFSPYSGESRKDWSGCELVLRGGPRLLSGGEVCLYPRGEGFRQASLFAPNRRTALGLTSDHKLLLVATNQRIYLSQLARALKALGAVDAINLDGGTSSAMFYRGSFPVVPGRQLTHALIIYDSGATVVSSKAEGKPNPN